LLDGLDRRVGPASHGDDDDRDVGVDAADLVVDLQPGLVGKAEIEDNNIRWLRADVFEPGMDCAGDVHPVRGCGERLAQLLRHEGRVVADVKETGGAAVVGAVVGGPRSPQLRGRARFQGQGRSVVGRQAQRPGTTTGRLPSTCVYRPEEVQRRTARVVLGGCL
jgi:hypothetical protein